MAGFLLTIQYFTLGRGSSSNASVDSSSQQVITFARIAFATQDDEELSHARWTTSGRRASADGGGIQTCSA